MTEATGTNLWQNLLGNSSGDLSGNIGSGTGTGNSGVRQRLQSLLSSGRVPHAFLFVGPTESGKRQVALAFAQALMCEKRQGVEACGVCRTCQGLERGQALGLHILEPEKGMIKIDAARGLLRQLALATLGQARVVVIDDAHLLNTQAANALLKSIEEPPDRTFFILISSSEENVLKTIRSRTQVVRFCAPKKENGEASADASFSAAWIEGARRICSALIEQNGLLAAEIAREILEDREQGIQLAYWLLRWVRGEWHEGGQNSQGSPLDRSILSRWSLYLLELARDLQGNCDLHLTLENTFLRMAEVGESAQTRN